MLAPYTNWIKNNFWSWNNSTEVNVIAAVTVNTSVRLKEIYSAYTQFHASKNIKKKTDIISILNFLNTELTIHQKLIWQINCKPIVYFVFNFRVTSISAEIFTFYNLISGVTKHDEIIFTD